LSTDPFAWLRLVHPDDQPIAMQNWELVQGGASETAHYELRHIKKDGSIVWGDVRARAVRDQQGQLTHLIGATVDITGRKRAEMILAMENGILEGAATGLPLNDLLKRIAGGIEAIAEHCCCSILLLDEDGQHLKHGAAPSLPDSYTAAIDGIPIGPCAGSCGTAVYQNRLTIVEDIATDPLWTDFQEHALRHGLRACWSMPIPSSSGRVLGTFAVYYHISNRPTNDEIQLVEQATRLAQIAIERKQAEQALKSSEEKLRQSLLASNTGLWEWNTETNAVWLSREWKAQIGYEEAELADMFESWESRLHPDDRTRAIAYAMQYRDQPVGPFRQDFRLRHKDGTYRWIDSHASFVTEPDGRRVRLLGSHTDITERKQAEHAVSEREARFRTLVANIPGAIYRCAVDKQWTMSYLSNAIQDIVGFPAKEFIANQIRSYASVIHPDDRRLVEEETWTSLEERRPYVIEYRLIHANGTVRWVYEKGQGVFTQDGEVRFLDGAIFDITDRKQAEEALRMSEERFAKAFQASPHPVVISELDSGLVVDANEAAWRLFGYRKEEVVGQTTLQIGLWQSVEERAQYLEQLRNEGSIRNAEVQLRS
ncbi:MAG: PAS domain S-box protein, partial [Nitrospira sp.]|nr:PAS domain S-box protein [Nitrospira sp.]